MRTTLTPLQRRLERIYQVAVEHDVADFVITDEALAKHLENNADARSSEEKLLVRQDQDNVDLTLYLDAQLVTRLADDDPSDRLHRGNLGDFCTALEGISHFLYVTWNATRRRSVTQLELEMQAEIDKYVVSVSLLCGQRRGAVPSRLHPILFDDCALDPALNPAERERYHDANRYAGKYCSSLENLYLRRRGRRDMSMLSELRRFYRLPLTAKLRRIESIRCQ